MIRKSEQYEILHSAFRYALGRATYVTGFIADALVYAWPHMSEQQRNQIRREITEAIAQNRFGMDMDRRQWERVLALPVAS